MLIEYTQCIIDDMHVFHVVWSRLIKTNMLYENKSKIMVASTKSQQEALEI